MRDTTACPRCHAPRHASARFCPRCGESLPKASARGSDPATGELGLHEDLLLLAIDDESGRVTRGCASTCSLAIAGGVLAELMLAKGFSVDEGKKRLVDVTDPRPPGDPLLDEVLERMHTSSRRRRLQSWVTMVARTKNLRDRIATGLCRRGILEAVEHNTRILFFNIHRKTYPTRDPLPEYATVARLREAIYSDAPKCDERTAILLSLASAAGLLSIRFPKKDLKARKQHIKTLAEGEAVGKAVRDVIAAMQAAYIAATTAAMAG